VKTAGSCFLSVAKEMPAWKLIDAAGLRGKSVGRVAISEKHANFLIAEKGATFEDAKELVHEVRRAVKHPLAVEMRFIEENAHPAF
jgi:UDP-N-acetylmuramate dehydrogenase